MIWLVLLFIMELRVVAITHVTLSTSRHPSGWNLMIPAHAKFPLTRSPTAKLTCCFTTRDEPMRWKISDGM